MSSDGESSTVEIEIDRIDENIEGLFTLSGDLRERIEELEEQNERQQRMLESLRTRVATPVEEGER